MRLSPRRHLWTRLQGCTPAWMQVVERRREQAAEVVEPRLEQAAEESRRGGQRGQGMAGFIGWHVQLSFVWWSFPLTRKWLVSTTGFRPSPE